MHPSFLARKIMEFINTDVKMFKSKKDKIRLFVYSLTNEYNTENIGASQIAGIRVYLIDSSDKKNPKIFIKSALIYNRFEADQYISKLRNSNIFVHETMFSLKEMYAII